MEIRKLIRELGDEHGVILSTHILPEVQSICSRVLVLNQGCIAFSDSISNMEMTTPSSLLFRLEHAPDLDEVRLLLGISSAEAISDGRIRVMMEANTPLAEISGQLVAKGWGLKEFIPERHTLEQVFTRLTAEEDT